VPSDPPHAGLAGRVAAGIIGLEAIGCLGFSLYFLLAASNRASLGATSHLMFSVLTVLFAAGLGLVSRGLWKGRSWPGTAAVVWFVLLLPVGWSLVQAGRGLVGVLILSSALLGIGAVAAESRS
jgi:hypothetical protein